MNIFGRHIPGTHSRERNRRDAVRASGNRPRARSQQFDLRRRLMLVGGTLALCSAALLARALDLQVVNNEFYQRQGAARFLREIPGHLLNEIRPRVQVARPMAAPPRMAHPTLVEQPALKLGQAVAHASFGHGVVTDYEGSGAHARVQVNFDQAGSKWLVLAFANLQPA